MIENATRAQAAQARGIVYVVDDDEDLRNSLCNLLASVGLRTVSCESAQAFLDRYDPDELACLILDARMPGLSGLALHARLSGDPRSIPVIILTGYPDVDMAVEAMKRGAFDYLQKPVRDQQLLDTTARALDADLERKQRNLERAEVALRMRSLSPRETQVLELVLDGLTSKEIAARLEIATRTVELHRVHVARKMRAESLAELVALCTRHRDVLVDMRDRASRGDGVRRLAGRT